MSRYAYAIERLAGTVVASHRRLPHALKKEALAKARAEAKTLPKHSTSALDEVYRVRLIANGQPLVTFERDYHGRVRKV